MDDTKLTSVKLITEWYKKFKKISIEEEFSLQKLVNRSMYRFIDEIDFRNEMIDFKIPVSGSKF